MKFGVREICDVVLKAKAAQKVGNKIFYAGEPVIYFDTLKTSSLEGASTTVYATGGRGNPNLISWDGERTVTFTMEDALISPEGFMILSGAGLIEASKDNTIKQHMTETVDKSHVKVTPGTESDHADTIEVHLKYKPYWPTKPDGNYCYVMLMKDGEIVSEPYIPTSTVSANETVEDKTEYPWKIEVKKHDIYDPATPDEQVDGAAKTLHDGGYLISPAIEEGNQATFEASFDSVLVDYYRELESNAKQIEITADKFGGNYYLEASTLFRDTNGVDMPAEFVIPNCRVQSNFTFTMAATGDPSEQMRLAA